MQLDVGSLLLALTVNLIAAAVTLPAAMGSRDGAARRAQLGMGLQAAGFALLLSTTLVQRGGAGDRLLSTLSMAGIACGLAACGSAFAMWCGRSHRQPALHLLAACMVIGYAAGFAHYEFRVGWANGLTALQMALVAAQLSRRPPSPVGTWRWLLVCALSVQAASTAARGMVGAFFPDALPRFNTPHPVNLGFVLVAMTTNIVTLVAILLAHRERAGRELERLASTDSLTGLLNRRAWFTRAEDRLASAREAGEPVVVVMLDVDRFKEINDNLGHEAGDRALELVGTLLQETGRSSDLMGRYGGEEFCVLMRNTSQAGAGAFDRRLREALQQRSTLAGLPPLTYSAGVAMSAGGHASLQELLQRADALLYRAKDGGRDRTLAEPPALRQVA